jgi:hypothetical protein
MGLVSLHEPEPEGNGSYLDISISIEKICGQIGSKSLKLTKISGISLNL